ncbi:MAG TPA: 3-hydroxyacyl-CoA dehydrogenase NAD-binding domain-containing protein, partial [Gemmata sp.]|nr:3-hydroxyacyl-CoA dehydrogenase NAD-binding domain-containing protein [Gemmata sp.]
TIGLVDRAFAPDEFDSGVKGFVEDVLAGRSRRRPSRGLSGMLLDGTSPGRALLLSTAEKRAHRRGRHYPALAAAIRSVRAGLRRGHDGGLAAEREEFPRLLFGPVAGNLIDLFLNREKARKVFTWVPLEHTPRKVQKAAVVGAGVMGAGIAQLLALNDIQVVLRDINAELTAAGMKRVEDLTREAEKKGAISATEAAAAIRNVTPTPDLDALTGCSLVIEAVVEREDIKQKVFRDLTERLGADVMLATNTSALSVSRIAQAVQRPGRVAGLHFFNPVHRMPLVEVVRGRDTNDATIASLVELVRKVGKVPVVVADSPGFLVNRILFPYMDEAVRLVLEGVPGEVVDREAVQFGMPMGPLELLDQVGIDIAADVAKTFAGLRIDLGPTPARFAQMVTDGALGKKAGRGFYTYRNDKRGAPTRWATMAGKPIPRTSEAEVGRLSEIERRLIYPMINEAAKCLDAGVVAEPWMVDIAMVLGTGFAAFRGGPLHTADSLGIARVVQEMEGLRKTQGDRFEPAEALRRMASESRHFYPQPGHALTAT